MSLDTKMTFSLKDVIVVIGFLITMVGGYLTLTSEVDQLKEDVSILKEANKAYTNLPRDVKTMKKDIQDNAELTKAIYLGLVAKGIIKPPQ